MFELQARSDVLFIELVAGAWPEERPAIVEAVQASGAEVIGDSYRVELRVDERLEHLASALRGQAHLAELAGRVTASVADRMLTPLSKNELALFQPEFVGLQQVAFLAAVHHVSAEGRRALVRVLDEIGASRFARAYRLEFRAPARIEQLASELRERPQFRVLEARLLSSMEKVQ